MPTAQFLLGKTSSGKFAMHPAHRVKRKHIKVTEEFKAKLEIIKIIKIIKIETKKLETVKNENF